jgi:hypothetical protein
MTSKPEMQKTSKGIIHRGRRKIVKNINLRKKLILWEQMNRENSVRIKHVQLRKPAKSEDEQRWKKRTNGTHINQKNDEQNHRNQKILSTTILKVNSLNSDQETLTGWLD